MPNIRPLKSRFIHVTLRISRRDAPQRKKSKYSLRKTNSSSLVNKITFKPIFSTRKIRTVNPLLLWSARLKNCSTEGLRKMCFRNSISLLKLSLVLMKSITNKTIGAFLIAITKIPFLMSKALSKQRQDWFLINLTLPLVLKLASTDKPRNTTDRFLPSQMWERVLVVSLLFS